MKKSLSFDKTQRNFFFGATTISKATLSIMAKLRLSFCVEICYAKSRKFCYAESWNGEIRSLVIMLNAFMGLSVY